ncbi:MAG: hypothetical protein H6513_12925 [Acidimicrobiaceae bacterium]|nr:hypothetical protein [Acidimicrobiaceae bacterium]
MTVMASGTPGAVASVAIGAAVVLGDVAEPGTVVALDDDPPPHAARASKDPAAAS